MAEAKGFTSGDTVYFIPDDKHGWIVVSEEVSDAYAKSHSLGSYTIQSVDTATNTIILTPALPIECEQ